MPTITIGRPIDVERYADRADDRMVLRQIIDEVMFEIRELTGQEYVDEYATKKAETIPPTEPPRGRRTSPTATADGAGDDAPPRRSSADVLGSPTG